MEIYILSKGRAHRQTTFNNLPPFLQDRVTIAVYPEELQDYRNYPAIPVHCEKRGVGHKRQWLLENCPSRKLVMLDDDLVFATRRKDDPTKFREAAPDEIGSLFDDIEQMLDQYAHVGVSGREGANRRTEPRITVGRMTRILGYQVDVLKVNNIRLDEMQLMEDFNTTLRLLRAGYPNMIINYMVQNQNGSNTAGGVSEYRTMEKQSAAAEELARKHPAFVSVVEKSTKTAWGGLPRKDVVIQWKRAYESAQ